VRQQIHEALEEAVRQVFQETGIDIEGAEPGNSLGTDAQVIATVGLTGDLQGILMLSTDATAAARIVQAMLGGLRVETIVDRMSPLQLAAIAEICNQVAGRAITLLSERGLRCDITPPAVVAASQMQSLVPDLAESFHQTLRGPFGRLAVFLGLSHADSAPSDSKN
jgi:chemotaxis protein CheX